MANTRVILRVVPRESVDRQDISEDWTISEILKKHNLHSSWEPLFRECKYELETISSVISEHEKRNSYSSLPLRKDIFAAFYETPATAIKVVILGQDPYYQILSSGLPRAVGLSFAVRKEDVVPVSLQNIYNELTHSYPGFVDPGHGDLTAWTKQGVFLLNTALTVQPNKPNSHSDVWFGFMVKTIKYILRMNPKTVFLLWGREAQKIDRELDGKGQVFECAHPSGRSAHKGFFGCNHFNFTNEFLTSQGFDPIDWKIPRD